MRQHAAFDLTAAYRRPVGIKGPLRRATPALDPALPPMPSFRHPLEIHQRLIYSAFDMLRPADRYTAQVQLWDNMWNDEYVKAFRRLQRWATDILPLPGEYFRQFTKNLTQANRLLNDELMLDGQRVRLADIRIPVLHAVAEHDHIVPPAAAAPLVKRIGATDKEEVILKGGHVSLVAGPNAVKRLWPKLDTWLGKRSV